MPDPTRTPSSALRPSQACAAELVAGGAHIAIPAKQPLGELAQAPVKEYASSASPAEIDAEEAALLGWADRNHRLFPAEAIKKFESQVGPKGGGSEHDAWKIELASQGWCPAGSLHNYLVLRLFNSSVSALTTSIWFAV